MLLSTNDKTDSLLQLSRIKFPNVFPDSQNIPRPFDLLVSSMKFLALQNTNVFQAHHRPSPMKVLDSYLQKIRSGFRIREGEIQTSVNGYKYICHHL